MEDDKSVVAVVTRGSELNIEPETQIMKPYTPNSNEGRTVGGDDIHHRTADQKKAAASSAAKAMRHAARRQGKHQAVSQRIEP